MPNIHSLSFDSNDWKKVQDSPNQMIWQVSPFETIMEEFKQPTDFKRDVLDPNIRLEFEEFVAESGGAIVDFQIAKIKGLETIWQIYKYWYPKPQDMRKVYLGAMAFPFADFCYILKIQCIESGTTGVREAAISLSLPKTEQSSKEPIVIRSMAEMFDHMKKTSMIRSASDDEQYDAQFPDHPLSRARWHLKHFADTLMISPDLQKARPYRVNKGFRFWK